MIQGVGGGGGLAREAIEAALLAQARSAQRIEQRVAQGPAADPGLDVRPFGETLDKGLGGTLAEGLRSVDRTVRAADGLAEDLVAGRVRDFHEIAGRMKQSELTFKFALEVRNKLVDAYRETMRMSV